VTVKTFIVLQKILFQINAVLLNLRFYLSEDPVKNLMVCIKILSSTVLNIDHEKKHILTSKSAY